LDFRKFLASKKDAENFDLTLQRLCANPSDIIEIKCCLMVAEEVLFVTGKGMLVCDYTDHPTRVIWVFQTG